MERYYYAILCIVKISEFGKLSLFPGPAKVSVTFIMLCGWLTEESKGTIKHSPLTTLSNKSTLLDPILIRIPMYAIQRRTLP